MPGRIHIQEKRPTGSGTIKYVINQIESMSARTDDMTEFWKAATPDIKKAMKYTFSQGNPSGWAGLSAKYMKWKVDNGYPVTTGIMTGALKKAVTDDAIIEYKPREMTYRLNPNVRSTRSSKSSNMIKRALGMRDVKSVGDYAGYFNDKRSIFSYAREFVSKLFYDGARKYIMQALKERK